MRLTGNPRPHLPPYPDGSPRREYRCLRNADKPQACGKNHIDALHAEQAVDEAMRARLGDPRRAARMAAHLARVSERRAELEAEITRLEETADDLAAKTARWGVARVDQAMEPLLARMETVRSELATLEAPAQAETAAADAVRAWERAKAQGDFPAMRAMIKRAFPNLTLLPSRHFNDHSPDRIIWEPATPPAWPARETA
jgi:branched-subunit amino acid aminotransferase/4-amino-4-deoxychorismate lyase